MSRRNGYHKTRWIGVKRLRHRVVQDVLCRLFKQTGIECKYYNTQIPGAAELCSRLSDAWRLLDDKPSQILSLDVWVTRRKGEVVDLVLVTVVLQVVNQVARRRKSLTVCGTPKGYVRAINGG